jgi:hypothetical protein
MTIFIAHRGNWQGIEPDYENRLEYMRAAHNYGYAVECDLQMYNGALYFGHDEPQEQVDWGFIGRPYVFCHAKTIDTMQVLLNSGVHCFWHENDKMTLTNMGFMWCYPGVYPVNHRAIWLDLQGAETPIIHEGEIFGVCGDDFNNVKWIKRQ